MISKVFVTLRTHWKKSIFFSGCTAYAGKFFLKWHTENLLMQEYCLRAREVGRQKLSSTERPRKIIIFLNPAAKSGKTRYLLEKHVLPILHLAGIEIHVVKTEHEGQAKAYMNVIDNNIVDAILVAGGDGTISEIVTGILRRGDDIANRIPIGVLPFGNTNSYASTLFPPKELEVERYCQASMAVVENRVKPADVIEVRPQEGSGHDKSVFIMSHLKWGVHSEIERTKSKYWYMPGPLKQYYCYLKQAFLNPWPPSVSASVQVTSPCNGCKKCLPPPTTKQQTTPPTRWSWLWASAASQRITSHTSAPDPRYQMENPSCGIQQSFEIETPQLFIIPGKQDDNSGSPVSVLEMRQVEPYRKKTEFLNDQGVSTENTSCITASQITINPKTSEPWFIMDSEKYETLPADIRILKDRINVFTL